MCKHKLDVSSVGTQHLKSKIVDYFLISVVAKKVVLRKRLYIARQERIKGAPLFRGSGDMPANEIKKITFEIESACYSMLHYQYIFV